MRVVLAITTAATLALGSGAARAQAFYPTPGQAQRGYADGCNQFTLAGAHAGVTVLGVDVGASAGLHVGLHDRCRGGGQVVVYAPPQGGADYPPPPYAQPAYQGGYAEQGYAGGGYGYQASYAAGGWSGGYPAQPGDGYAPPCGC